MAFLANQIGFKSSGGYMYTAANNTGVSFSYTTSYQELTAIAGLPFSLSASSQDFAMTTDGRLKYTGIQPKRFMFDALLQSTGGATSTSIMLYKNGSPVTGSDIYITISSGINISKFPVQMVTNDYVSLWAKKQSNLVTSINQIILSAVSANGS